MTTSVETSGSTHSGSSAGRLPTVDIVQAENLAWLRAAPSASCALVYLDPPFNTGKRQRLRRLKTERAADGDRVGFAGARYRTTAGRERSYDDRFEDYLGFLRPRFAEVRRLLTATGSLFVHVDPRESHYVKVLLDELFGRASFMNEIVWAYDYGARSRSRWSAKHDVILWYAMDPRRYTFHYDAIDRIPYMAPKLVGEEKARRGKTPTDVWWQTIVSPTSKERTGYPTQKPLRLLERIVTVHSSPGDTVLDAFAGSGTAGEAAWRHGRRAILVDENPEAIEVMAERLAAARPRVSCALGAAPPTRHGSGPREEIPR